MGRKTPTLTLDNQFQQDIPWFNCFLEKFYGVLMIHKHAQLLIHEHVDASLTGIGAIWDEHVYADTYPPYYFVDKSIVHLEMCNILIHLPQ